jgi:transposase
MLSPTGSNGGKTPDVANTVNTGETQNQWLSPSTMCRALQREQLTLKKRRRSQCATASSPNPEV